MNLEVVELLSLAPDDLGDEVYLMTFKGADFQFSAGDWLVVQGRNSAALVEEFAAALGLDLTAELELKKLGKISLRKALTDHLELTFLDPALLNRLERNFSLGLWADRDAMRAYAVGKDVLDLIYEFPQIRALGMDLVALLAPLFPRYYSVANANKGDGLVSILFKKVVNSAGDRSRFGVTTSYLAGLSVGDKVEVEFKPNPQFGLPEVGVAVVMLGAGTGLAPFLSFVEERELAGAKDNWLIFGETYSKTRFLLREKLQAWVGSGFLELDAVFSRDTSERVYVQDRLLEKSEKWLQLWEAGAITYICGGKDGLGVGVEKAIKQIWEKAYGWDLEEQNSAWSEARKEGKIRLDLY